MYVIFGVGAFQTFIFSLLLLIKKETKTADKFLSLFFFVITLYLLNLYSIKFSFWKMFPDSLFVISLVLLSYGPVLYFYVRALIGKPLSRKQILYHLLPVIGVFLILLPAIFSSEADKLLFFTDRSINLPINVSVSTFLQYLSAPFYFSWILILLRKHKQYLKDNHSTIDEINLQWMQKLLYGVISILFIDCMNALVMNFSSFEFPFYISWYIKFIFLSFIIIIGYYGINQGVVFANIHQFTDTEKSKLKDEKIKIIPDEIVRKQTGILVEYMEVGKAYLNSELRIQDISVDLNIPVHVLSQLINSQLNQNFYDFVNKYRIEETKSRLLDPQYCDLTIVAIAHDCGFNSKATFNRLFKKYTNLTPSQFKMLKI